MRIVPRTEIGLPAVVRKSNGDLRPPMPDPADGMTVHYTGVDVRYANRDTADAILQIERWAASMSKPFEYNYVIDQRDNGLVYEYAGHFRAAHAGQWNGSWYGVLLLNGTEEPLSDAQAEKFVWLREQLGGEVLGVVPHRAQRPTACPGDLIMSDFEKLTVPYVAPPPPVVEPDDPEEDPEEDEMLVAFVQHKDKPFTYKQFINGTKTWVADPAQMALEKLLNPGLPYQVYDDNWTRAAGVIVGPKPPGVDGWGVPL